MNSSPTSTISTYSPPPHTHTRSGYPIPPLLTSGGHHGRLVQTCLLEGLPHLHGTDILWRPPKHIRLASGLYASYWNAVLFRLLWGCGKDHIPFAGVGASAFLGGSCLHLDLNCLKQQQLSIYDDVMAILSAMVLVAEKRKTSWPAG